MISVEGREEGKEEGAETVARLTEEKTVKCEEIRAGGEWLSQLPALLRDAASTATHS